jgi:HEAT repeat protein
MNEMFAPGGPLAEPLQQILLPLRDTGRSHIIFAVADDAKLRREVTAELAERLSGTYAFREFDFVNGQPSLPRFCRTQHDELPICVIASGLETLRERDTERYEEALRLLNMHREDIRNSGAAVVLPMNSEVFSDVVRRAPDFADWLTAQTSFNPPDGRAVQVTDLGRLSITEAEALRRQARDLTEMLGRPGLEPAMAAELQKQLAAVLNRLGQTDRSSQMLAESSRTAASISDYRHLEELYRQHVIDRFSKLTLYSVTSDAPLAVDLEKVFVKLTATPPRFALAERWGVLYESLWPRDRPAEGVRTWSSPGTVHALTLMHELGHLQLAETRERRDATVPVDLVVSKGLQWSGIEEVARKAIRNAFFHSPVAWEAVTKEAMSPRSIVGTLSDHLRVSLIGAPGAGKTTLLKYLALTFARRQAGERLELEEERLPIFVALRDFNRYLDGLDQGGQLLEVGPELLARFLSEHTRTIAPHLSLPDDFFGRQLDAGDCIVLLDGLDEVADPLKRARAAEAVATFVGHYRGNRFVVTSRPRGYEGETRQKLSPLFVECTIQKFDDDDMAQFAQNWYEAVTRDRLGDSMEAIAEARREAEDLLRAIRAEERVKALASNPLLLSVLAMVHQRGVGLPQRRAELYDECTDLLLGYWDQTKGGEAARELATYGELNRSEKRSLLEPVALWFHERGAEGLEADKNELEREIARQFRETFGDDEKKALRRAALFLRVIEERAGLLVERETGVYAFAHLTFQEYLAARAIADREDYIDYTLRDLHYPWWREVHLLEIGHLSDVRHFGRRARKLTTDLILAIRSADSWLEEILKRDLLFAARAVADVGPLGMEEELRRSILDDVLSTWRTTPFRRQEADIVEIFAYMMPGQDGVRLREEFLQLLGGEDEAMRTRAATPLEKMGQAAATGEVVDRLLALLDDERADVRWWAACVVGRMGQALMSEKVVDRLLAMLDDEYANVRWWAVEALGLMGQAAASEKVVDRLLTLLLDDEKAVVRQHAAGALGQVGQAAASEKVVDRLLAMADDEQAGVREQAARALGEMGQASASEKVVDRLLALLDDEETDVREQAAWALGRIGQAVASERVVDRLLGLLDDGEAGVRWQAAWALGLMGQAGASEKVVDRLLTLQDDDPGGVGELAAWASGQSDASEKVVERLLVLLDNEEADVRKQAAEALGLLPQSIASEDVVARLLTLLADRNADVRGRAGWALERMGQAVANEEVVDRLLALLEDDEGGVRELAARLLGHMGQAVANEEVVDRLLAVLDDEHAGVRWQAARALGRIPGGRAKVDVQQRLASFWQTQLGRTGYDFIAGHEGRVSDIAYEELRRIAALSAASGGRAVGPVQAERVPV